MARQPLDRGIAEQLNDPDRELPVNGLSLSDMQAPSRRKSTASSSRAAARSTRRRWPGFSGEGGHDAEGIAGMQTYVVLARVADQAVGRYIIRIQGCPH